MIHIYIYIYTYIYIHIYSTYPFRQLVASRHELLLLAHVGMIVGAVAAARAAALAALAMRHFREDQEAAGRVRVERVATGTCLRATLGNVGQQGWSSCVLSSNGHRLVRLHTARRQRLRVDKGF